MQVLNLELELDYQAAGLKVPEKRPAFTGYILRSNGEYCPKRPAVLICPGGGYGFTSDREATPIAMAFLAAGIDAFVLRYTCAPEAGFPTQLVEAAAAMRQIRSHAEEWELDESRIAICGFSWAAEGSTMPLLVFSSAMILTMRTSCPMGANTSGIDTISFSLPSATLFAFANLYPEKSFAFANWLYYITAQACCQRFERTFFKFSTQTFFSDPYIKIRGGRYRPVLEDQKISILCRSARGELIWRDRGNRRRPLPRS